MVNRRQQSYSFYHIHRIGYKNYKESKGTVIEKLSPGMWREQE